MILAGAVRCPAPRLGARRVGGRRDRAARARRLAHADGHRWRPVLGALALLGARSAGALRAVAFVARLNRSTSSRRPSRACRPCARAQRGSSRDPRARGRASGARRPGRASCSPRHDAVAAGRVGQPLHRLFAHIGQPAEEIISPFPAMGAEYRRRYAREDDPLGAAASRGAPFSAPRRRPPWAHGRSHAPRSPPRRSSRSPARSGIDHIDHGDDGEPLVRPPPRLAARRGRQAGGPQLHRRERRRAPDVPARARLPGLLVPRSRPLLRGRRASSGTTARATAGSRGQNDLCSIGYYRQQDLPFLGKAAPAFTTCDRFFASIIGPTFPNRIYSLSGVTDRLRNTTTRIELPTIFDRLAAKQVSAGYYYGNFSFLLLYQRNHGDPAHARDVLQARRTGKLPAFSYVDPSCTFHDAGRIGQRGNDDHPHADIRAGEYFLSQIYNAVTTSPAWTRTLLIITFDEWGGFFDHVPPPAANDVKPEYEQRGFRVPCLLISPFARRGQRRARRLRPHVDPQAPRVAVGPRAALRARRCGAQSRRGARLLETPPRDAEDHRAAARRRRRLSLAPDQRPAAASTHL